MKYINHNNLLFLREVFASGVEQIRLALRLAARYPEWPLSAAAGAFYLHQLEHLPLLWRLLFAAVGVAFTWGLIYAGRIWLRQRLAQSELRLGPELVVAGILVAGVYWTDFVRESWQVVILPIAFWLWLLWLSWRGRVGAFYAGFVGLLLFVLAVSAYRVLFVQEWLYGYAAYYSQRQAAVAELEQRHRWEQSDGGRTLYRSDNAVLRVPELPGVWFHDSRLISFIYGVPEPGVGICYLSASEQDPFAVPAVAVFQANRLLNATGREVFSKSAAPELSESAIEFLRDTVERAMLLRRRNGEIESLEYRGPTRLPAFLKLKDLNESPGILYTYRDRLLDEDARLIMYLTPDRRYIVVVNDAPDPGLLFEPTSLAILRGIRLPDSR
ncbi:MAG: hypothetical protein NXI24_04960 [bacterium]|nr:hypothetical protein [bacterium]